MAHWTDTLVKLHACLDAIDWARQFDTFAEAWQACERGDWMLWLAAHYVGGPRSKSRKELVYAACQCARTSWRWMPKAGRDAIKITEAWTRGEAKLSEVARAAGAAWAARVAGVAGAAWVAEAARATEAASKRHAGIVRKHVTMPKLPS